jgi:hypothetical protein
MKSRKMLLFIDNFSEYKLDIQLIGDKTDLSNIEIEFLSKNTTLH